MYCFINHPHKVNTTFIISVTFLHKLTAIINNITALNYRCSKNPKDFCSNS